MDIGAAISKKIQMAITAKLKELNAYVDDELPDYIMIMVANRKTEAQMRDALSLFLSENTEDFTSWLHSLLATLRRTKTEKKGNVSPIRKTSETAEVGQEENSLQQELGNQDEAESEMAAKEPVITINPESDDVLDKELQADIPSSNVQHPNISPSVVSRSRGILPQPVASKPSSSKVISLKATNEKITEQRKEILGEESHVRSRDRDENPKKRDLKRPRKPSKTSKASLSSTVSQVIQNSSFVSDDDSGDEAGKPKVSSKVAYPRRKMRVPLNKQANKALLMRAVSEAEKSVRKRDEVSEKVEELKNSRMQTAIVQVGLTEQHRQPRPAKEKKKASQRTTKIRRQIDVAESLLKSQKVQSKPKTYSKVESFQEESKAPPSSTVQKSLRNRISVPKNNAEERSLPPLVCDERKFILQETDSGRVDNIVSPIQFDSRHTKRHADAPLQDYVESGKKQKVTARVTPRPHNPNDQMQMASPPHAADTAVPVSTGGPVFIVTLDGVVSSKQTTFNSPSSVGASKVKSKKITSIPSPQPISVAQEARQPQAQTNLRKPPSQKANQISVKHTAAANMELEQMKKKMLELQTEAAKLKKMQATLVAAKTRQHESIEANGGDQAQDQSSIYICNVHYSTTEKQLSEYFSICGKVSRVTLLKDAKTSQPSGYAYLEFESKRAVSSALALNNSRFNDRVIKVTLKQSKQALPFPAARGVYHPRRPRIRGFRGARFRKSIHSYTTRYGVQQPQTRNKTWVNPSLSKK